MDEGKIGHHHAECLGPIYSAENFAANSIQFIGYLVCQWEYERGVNALKWNVQPRAVIERHKLRLCRLGFEILLLIHGQSAERRSYYIIL